MYADGFIERKHEYKGKIETIRFGVFDIDRIGYSRSRRSEYIRIKCCKPNNPVIFYGVVLQGKYLKIFKQGNRRLKELPEYFIENEKGRVLYAYPGRKRYD